MSSERKKKTEAWCPHGRSWNYGCVDCNNDWRHEAVLTDRKRTLEFLRKSAGTVYEDDLIDALEAHWEETDDRR